MKKVKAFFKTEIMKIVAPLTIITTVTALLLGVVNAITAPIIEKNSSGETTKAMSVLIETADKFENVDLIEGTDSIITEFYKALDKDGSVIGYTVTVAPQGYGGPINSIVAFDSEGVITGTQIVSLSETPGFGSKLVEDPSFVEQYVGKNLALEVVKNASADNEISAISGATISSNAMTKGVNAAINYVAANK